ncbi:MAG TPA: FliM/FliN family flagellar motor switch protein [Gaiellaceae bacterium]|jgi:flagellar motor switch protein FliN/FliY|nr:FliM/FliN family flagellar motor switch protein [Gaiellaceae bacterium]
MTTDEALVKLTESTAGAVAGVLDVFCPGAVGRGVPTIVPKGADPLDGIPTPAVAADVSYVDGVTGGNVFVFSTSAARRLALAMMGQDPAGDDGTELSELELSAVSEAMNQMMAAAAAATGTVLGTEVEISVPETRFFTDAGDARGAFQTEAHATSVPLTLFGEPCRLVQLIPNAFTVRMTRALDQRAAELAGELHDGQATSPEALRDVKVRVWAELGRSRLPVGRAVGLGLGAIVELDREVDAPVDLFVNGHRFALGRLLLADGDWAVQVETILEASTPSSTPTPAIAQEGVA